MWNRTLLLLLVSISFFCNDKTMEKGDHSFRCVDASSNYKTINKISEYFEIKFNEIEKQGIDFHFLLGDDFVEFAFWSLPNNLKEPIVKIEENIFYIPNRKIYIGIKFNEVDKDFYVWIERSKKSLFRRYEMVGSIDKQETFATCLNRVKINQIYEERKQEIEAGPEPDGDYLNQK